MAVFIKEKKTKKERRNLKKELGFYMKHENISPPTLALIHMKHFFYGDIFSPFLKVLICFL